jgi:hypothetical protein
MWEGFRSCCRLERWTPLLVAIISQRTGRGSVYRIRLPTSPGGTSVSRRTDIQIILKDEPGPRQLQYTGGYLYIADKDLIVDELGTGPASSIKRVLS